MGNKATKPASKGKSPITFHKRTPTESELYNFRDNVDYQKSTQFNFQEFINNQNQLNALLKAYLLQNCDTHLRSKMKRQPFGDSRHRDRDLMVDLPYARQQKVELEALKTWIQQVAHTVCQQATRGYSRGELGSEEISKFCVQNILENMSNLYQTAELSSQHLRELQDHLVNLILPTLPAKYPAIPLRQITKMLSTTDFAVHSQIFVIEINNAQTDHSGLKQPYFKEMLDRRDVVLQHDFDFKVEISFKEIEMEDFRFTSSKPYKMIIKHISKHLTQAVANIFSVSFKALNDGFMLQSQVKNYVALNIALNIRSLFIKTVQAIQKCSRLKRKTDTQGLKNDLLFHLQSILTNILANLSNYYNQIPANSFSNTPRDVIQINRSNDERNDLLSSNGLAISKYFVISKQKEDDSERTRLKTEDYTEFIMEVINTAIRSVRSKKEDARERSLKERFAQFNEELFMLCQNQHFRGLIQLATGVQSTSEESNLAKKAIYNYFRRVVETNEDKLKQLQNIIKWNKIQTSRDGEQKSFQNIKQRKNTLFQYSQSFSDLRINAEIQNKPQVQVQNPNCKLQIQRNCFKINYERDRQIQLLKNQKRHVFQQLIPDSVKMFTKKELSSKHFAAKDPSILKVLIKWGQQLQDIFVNAQSHVIMRAYPFKDVNNEPIYISARQKDQLLHNLKNEYKEAKQKLMAIKAKNNDLVAQILFKEQHQSNNVFRYNTTREAFSKISAVVISLMVDYLSVLITHLLRAGELQKSQTKESCHLNLVIFGISNLLSSKLHCNQLTLTTMLKTLNILDECDALQNRYRLVRIKNNLKQRQSEVRVNYMFMGRVQCELDLVLERPVEKERNYLSFQRFILELAKGNFGVLSKCAEVIAQYDPIVSTCQQVYYTGKKVQQAYQVEAMKQQEKPLFDISHLSRISSLRQTFECQVCDKLIINQNTHLFTTVEGAKMCIKCQLERQSCLQKISSKKLRIPLLQNLRKDKIKRVTKYAELKITNQNFIPLLKVDNNSKLSLIITVFVRSELNNFFITLSDKTIKQTIENTINFDELQYVNITKLVKGKVEIRQNLIFQIRKPEDLSKEILQMMGFNHKEYVQHIFQNATLLANRFQSFRKEKTLIKSIKFKAEIINCDSDREKWQIFAKLLQIYSKGKVRQSELNKLKYKKVNFLEFDRIKLIQANNCNIVRVPQQIKSCVNVQQFIIEKNEVKDCVGLKLKKLKVLKLQHNLIEKAYLSLDLKQLQYLDLTYNQLQTTDGFASLTNLKQLNLSSNHLHRVDGISSLINLNKLYLKQNQLQSIQGLSNLTNLTYLELSSNKLSNVDSLANLVNLCNLYLGWNDLKNVNGLSQLSHLQILDLNLNELKNVDGISTLMKMKELYLSSNQLRDVSGISNLVGLTKLVLSFNQLENLDFLSKTVNLQFLSVNENKLKNSCSFKKLYKLREISVQDNDKLKITELPVSLQKLYADFSAIEGIDFKNMINLKEVNVKGQRMSMLTNLPQNVQIKKVD